MSISSAAEGATHVTCLAEKVAGWEDRRATATVHWIDGQWNFPPPAVGNMNTGTTICTQIARATSGAPLPGWRVQYDIVGGIPAAFADGSQSTEAVSDSAGVACVNISPTQPQPGVTHVSMRVIRTGLGTGDPTNITLGEGTTTVTWSPSGAVLPPYQPPFVPVPVEPPGYIQPPNTTQPPGYIPPPNTSQPPGDSQPTLPPVGVAPPVLTTPQLELRVTGPPTAKVDRQITYSVVVRNPDNVAAEDVEVSSRVPDALRFVRSEPLAQVFGDRLVWNIGTLAGGQLQEFTVTYDVLRA